MDCVAHQAPLSMGFSRQEYWSGLPLPFSRGSSQSRDQTCVSCTAGIFFTVWVSREAPIYWWYALICIALNCIYSLLSSKHDLQDWKSTNMEVCKSIWYHPLPPRAWPLTVLLSNTRIGFINCALFGKKILLWLFLCSDFPLHPSIFLHHLCTTKTTQNGSPTLQPHLTFQCSNGCFWKYLTWAPTPRVTTPNDCSGDAIAYEARFPVSPGLYNSRYNQRRVFFQYFILCRWHNEITHPREGTGLQVTQCSQQQYWVSSTRCWLTKWWWWQRWSLRDQVCK